MIRLLWPRSLAAFGLALAHTVAAGCSSPSIPTRYYELVPPAASDRGGATSEPALAVAEFLVDGAYSDERIVYRESTYRLDYYNYHRWASAPEEQVAHFLELAYAASGHFGVVTRKRGRATAAVLSGTLIALEEVDRADGPWLGRVEVLLRLESPDGTPLWERRVSESEPLPDRTPEGLAAALSRALSRIVDQTAAEMAAAARRGMQTEPTGGEARGGREVHNVALRHARPVDR